MDSAEPQHRVLVIYSSRSNIAGNVVIEDTLRSVLTTQNNLHIDYRIEFINNTSALSKEASMALRNFLRSKYVGEAVDVILTVGNDALLFARGYADELFPGAPIVSWGSRDLIENWGAEVPATGVMEPEPVRHIQGCLNFILRLQPDVREVVVVSGAAAADRQRHLTSQQALRQFEDRVRVTYFDSLPFEDLQNRLRNLPEKSAVLFLTMTEDGAGRKLLTRDVIVNLLPTTNAPIYSISAAHLGSGVVGGYLINQESMARDAAEITIRIIRGEHVGNIPPYESRAVPMVDARQLQRWKIPEDRLPPATAVLYKEPTFWELYKGRVIGGLSLLVLEAMLILGLLVETRKRARAEKKAAGNQALLQSTIDALQAHIALLDQEANIIAVNESWRRFAAASGYTDARLGVGKNYLQICDVNRESEDARMISQGLRSLMTGESSSFSYVYESSYDGAEGWFQLRATRFMSQGVLWLAVAHENITEIKRAHDIQQQHAGLLLQAQDEERRRIARDIHDATVQNIATIKAELTRAESNSQKSKSQGQETRYESVSLCDQVIQELRTLSYLLHPPLLDEAGLVAAVQWYVRGFVQRSGIHVEVLVIDDIGRLPSDVETTLFRVVQESLTNIHRHSGCRSALIWVMRDGGEVVLRIQDDGHGILERAADNPKAGQTLGVGILGMRQRLRQLGGRLEIDSDSHGTTVTARTPSPKEGYIAYSRG